MDIQVTGKNRTELLFICYEYIIQRVISRKLTQKQYEYTVQIREMHTNISTAFFTVLYGESGHGDITSGSVVGSGNHLLT